MSTKPSDAGRFAVDGSNVDATNISAPSGSLRNTGFPDDYVPPAAEFNYLENIAYRWRQYLSDGALQGNHSIAGNLSVTGDLSFTGGLSVTGTLDVSGLSTLSTVTTTGLITASAGLTAAANQNVTISGTGRYKHPTRTLNVALTPQTTSTSPNVLTWTSTGVQFVALPLLAGKTITAIRSKVQDTAGTTIQINLFGGDGNTGFSIVFGGLSSAVSNGSGTVQTLVNDGSGTPGGPLTLLSTQTYYVRWANFTGLGGNGSAFSLQVDYDER